MQEVSHASMPGPGVVSGDSWSAKTREELAGPGGGIGHQLRRSECEPGRGARRVYWIELTPRRGTENMRNLMEALWMYIAASCLDELQTPHVEVPKRRGEDMMAPGSLSSGTHTSNNFPPKYMENTNPKKKIRNHEQCQKA